MRLVWVFVDAGLVCCEYDDISCNGYARMFA